MNERNGIAKPNVTVAVKIYLIDPAVGVFAVQETHLLSLKVYLHDAFAIGARIEDIVGGVIFQVHHVQGGVGFQKFRYIEGILVGAAGDAATPGTTPYRAAFVAC